MAKISRKKPKRPHRKAAPSLVDWHKMIAERSARAEPAFLASCERLRQLFAQYAVEDVLFALNVTDLWLPNISAQVKHQLAFGICVSIPLGNFASERLNTYERFADFSRALIDALPSFPSLEDYWPEADWGDTMFIDDVDASPHLGFVLLFFCELERVTVEELQLLVLLDEALRHGTFLGLVGGILKAILPRLAVTGHHHDGDGAIGRTDEGAVLLLVDMPLERSKQSAQKVAVASIFGDRYADWWGSVLAFLTHVGKETLVALSPDYESQERLREVIRSTKQRIEELLRVEPNLPKALQRLADDQAVRILTIHKSKGLEFDSVIMLAVEEEIFFGDQGANRCAFFVGVSRAKRRLVLTHADQRERPAGYTKRWDVVRKPQSEYFGYVMPFVGT